METKALASDKVASRLERQEEDIRWLWAEVLRLREELQDAPDRCQAEGPCLTREVAQLRAENRSLRYRLHCLRVCFGQELIHQAKMEHAAAWAAASAPGTQPPPPCQSQEKTKKKKKEERELSAEERKQLRFIWDRARLLETLKEDRQLLFTICQNEGNTRKVISVRVASGETVPGEVWKSTTHPVASKIR